jgi:L-amino acid N-acyltransferase YncA
VEEAVAHDITIRPAIRDDLASITDIYAHAVTNGTSSYELQAPSLDEMTERFDALVKGGFPYLVAQGADKAVIGYAYAGAFRPRPAYRFSVEDSLYLAPDAQGRGVGAMLLQELIVACTARGYRQIFAVIGDGQPSSPSVRLHEKLGFRHSGRLEGSGFKFGRWLDTAIMQLSINGGNGTPPT